MASMLEGSKILLVDDNPEIIDILTGFLSLNGCTICTASTGKEALDEINKKDFEIVVLDVELPDANGISLLDTIKIARPDMSVVMMTGSSEMDFVINAMKKGASDYLVKPFDFDKLLVVLMRVLRERSLLLEKHTSLEDKKKIEVLNRELQKKIRELTTMYHISNKFNTLSIFDDVYEKMLQIITETVTVNLCGYYIVDSENSELVLYRENAVRENGVTSEKRIPLSEVLLPDGALPKKFLIRNRTIYLPLIIKGECIGFISVRTRESGVMEKHHPSESDVFFLRLISEKASIQIENRILYESLYESVLHTLTSLIDAINKRDQYTEGHCHRVTLTSVALAKALGLSEYEKDVLRVVGPIHDLGKVGIPDAILLKPGRLEDYEYGMMKTHSLQGEQIMSRFEILSNEAKIIRHHHERYDGKGYPDGLEGEGIPKCARVVAVCDSFDAMVTTRPYRTALSKKDAVAELEKNKGTQFDPEICECFIDIVAGNKDYDRN
jgi:response regulator RpfG family c-di-GMP phosphodiesterase